MNPFFRKHPVVKWTFLAGVGALSILVLALLLFDWNMLRGPIARYISAKTGLPATIDGNLTAHVWSLNPTLSLEDLNIRNPAWADRDRLFSVKKITLQMSLPNLMRGHLVLQRVELISPAINLDREQPRRANWDTESTPATPANASPHLPVVRQLIISDGKVHVVDKVRKLSFDGTLVAQEQAGTQDPSAFRLNCAGLLNDRPFKMQAKGGPLLNVDPNKPYTFDAGITAGDTSLVLQATIPKPFDLSAYRATFTLDGRDLADAYYLTNLALPNTAKYHLHGTLQHRGNRFSIDDFRGVVGRSDVSGEVAVAVENKRPKLTAKLTSKQLDITDLAAPLGRNAPASNAARPVKSSPVAAPVGAGSAAVSTGLLPDADLQVERVRAMDADVTFQSQSVTGTKMPIERLQFHLMLDQGVLRLDPLSFALSQGQFAGTVRIDAAGPVPESDIDMNLQNVDLSQFKPASAKDAPLQGTMTGRVKLHGIGESVHKFASGADGSIRVIVPHGQIRAALAELAGIDVANGLGLLLTQNKQEADLRCGVASFQADQGKLNASAIVLDTTNVLITGHGN
ncbi:MAG TPA: AsmA family protein, partial [Steroidobacteraceae bacterium]